MPKGKSLWCLLNVQFKCKSYPQMTPLMTQAKANCAYSETSFNSGSTNLGCVGIQASLPLH